MHIHFKNIRYKNILSVGNQFVEINFTDVKTTLLSGSNGAGKSTMIEAIVFVLYGRSFRKINKPQLVNSVNQKDMLVEVEFSIGSSDYTIRRGIKPNIFEVLKDGVILNKDAASKDYQDYLEQSILKMTYKSFTQIVILGSATYVPFMDLPTGQRREIIEDLLDIQVFSTMNTLLKDRISSNKTLISDNNHSVDLLKMKITSAKEHNVEIRKLKLTEVDKLKLRISEHLTTVERDKVEIEGYETNITELATTIRDKSKQKTSHEKVKELIYDLDTKQKTFEKEIDFYSVHDNCPTCKQGIEHEFKQAVVEEKTSRGVELGNGIVQLQNKKTALEQRLEEISVVEDDIQKLHTKASECRLSVKMTINQLNNIKEELQSAEKDVQEIDQSRIVEYAASLTDLEGVQTDLYEQRETLGVVATMLKDGGIKTSIVRTYIPIMNTLINQYLSGFELFVDFNLDENFNEVIKSRFRDTFSFGSFSEGEKMRINLSLLFSWRALSKLRNSVSTNLLILDEILDSGSDAQGVDSLLEILKKLNANDNIFVITHRGDAFTERFDRHLKFEKVKNFTQVAESADDDN
jgi:DNA repair exonuclease SbcCD ATPase subunit